MTAVEEKRIVYSTEEGKRTLLNLLEDLGTFRAISPDEVPLRNEGIKIMAELGILDRAVIKKLLDRFFELDLRKVSESKEEKDKRMQEYIAGLIPAKE